MNCTFAPPEFTARTATPLRPVGWEKNKFILVSIFQIYLSGRELFALAQSMVFQGRFIENLQKKKLINVCRLLQRNKKNIGVDLSNYRRKFCFAICTPHTSAVT
jgi:hypothetical protein